MKPSATILALICMGATATRSEWIYNRSTDPLTDDDVHVLLCSPTNTTRKIELTKPSALAINITNGKPVVAIIAVPEFTTEKTYPVTIRFDRKKACTIQCLISKDRDLLFPAKQREFAEEILASNGLIISLETAFGSRIDFFDLRGLDALLKKHNLKLFKTTPRAQKFVEDVRNSPPPKEYEKLLVIEKAKEYASPKLKDPGTFSVTEVKHLKHSTGDFYLVRFTADGRNLRVGVRITDDGKLTVIDKSLLPAILESSTPMP